MVLFFNVNSSECLLHSTNADTSVVFNENVQHQWEVVSGVFVTNWNLDAGINGNQLVILADDKDSGDPSRSPLRNGLLFSVTYPDEVMLSLALDSFVLSSDLVTMVNMDINPDPAVFGAGENILTFTPSAVPIPSAILLLGGGLLGMLGIRRKMKK